MPRTMTASEILRQVQKLSCLKGDHRITDCPRCIALMALPKAVELETAHAATAAQRDGLLAALTNLLAVSECFCDGLPADLLPCYRCRALSEWTAIDAARKATAPAAAIPDPV